MIFSIRNRLLRNGQVAPANLTLEPSMTSRIRAASPIRAPPILRHGSARGTSNRVQWDGIVRVKPIDLEFWGTRPVCARCQKDRRSYRCTCNRWDSDAIGGLRVCIDTHEAPRTVASARSFPQCTVKPFSFNSTDRPAELPVSQQTLTSSNITAPPATQTKVRRSKRARRRNTLQEPPEEQTVHVTDAKKSVKTNGDVANQNVLSVPSNKSARVLKNIKTSLDGMYWTTPIGPRLR
jgi:hypothetical protein